MKRFLSSVFILLILLNVLGYYVVFMGLMYKNSKDLIQKFDAGDYNAAETQTAKIPFHSNFSSENYQRVDGDFEHDGKIYRLIKQRLYRDTFHIVYMKDKVGTAIHYALIGYVKTFSEGTLDNANHVTTLPLFIKEYFTRDFAIQNVTCGYEKVLARITNTNTFIDSFTSSIIHPPERG